MTVFAQRFGLGVVAITYAVAQLLLFHQRRALDWDESVYLSQVLPSLDAIDFAASRSRGIVVLVWPFAAVSAPLPLIRIYLSVLAAIVLFVAFRLWQPIIGTSVVLAAGLFAFAWPALFYGSEIYPNLWSALAGVAAVGGVVRQLRTPRRKWILVTVSAFAFMALMRPVDAALAALAVSVAIVALRTEAALRAFMWAVIGCAVGALPWVVEAMLRRGSLGQALKDARAAVGGTGRGQPVILEHLFLSDGPLFGLDPQQEVPAFGLAWWIGLIVLSVLAVAVAGSGSRRWVLLPLITGGALATFYLAFDGAFAPRFLLPAYALLSLTAGAAFAGVAGRPRVVTAMTCAVGTVVIASWAVWSVGVARRLEAEQVSVRDQGRILGAEVRHLAGAQCSFASQYAYPQISVYSDCRGGPLVPGAPLPTDVDLVVSRTPPEDYPTASDCRPIASSAPGWYIYDCR